MGDDDYQIKRDSLGKMGVPADAYWSAQTQWAVESFSISDTTFGRWFIHTLGVVKKTAAQIDRDLGMIDEGVAAVIVKAADEIIVGELDDQFPVDVFQTGSGMSSNMNANEVIVNRIVEIMGEGIGDHVIHSNDHTNFGQSSNDVISMAMHVTSLEAAKKDLLPALEMLAVVLGNKEAEFDGIIRTGRTRLQDATPVRLGQEFGGYHTQIERGIRRVEDACEHLGGLALGGIAVGTELSTHPEFPVKVAEYVTGETGVEFREADNHFETQAAHGAMSEAYGAFRTVAGSLNKIASDLRLLASGPCNGLGELEQPENQPGSSIVPGKVNPVIAKTVNQVHKQVVGNDAAVSADIAEDQIDLNLYKPVLAHNFFESAKLLTNSPEVSTERFVAKLEANEEHYETRVERSIALATVFSPVIGYDKASKAARKTPAEDKSVRQVVVDGGYLTEAETDEVLDPEKVTHRSTLGDD